MIRKEWNQNIAWALLGAIGFGIALTVTVRNAYYTQTQFPLEAYWMACLKACTLAAPVLGFLMGLLQILPEKRRDLWAFLMHRPVSTLTLFAGKALAGAMLYAIAIGIPIVGAAWYAAAPGHLNGPFDVRMPLDCVGAAFAGWPCYFAGLLVALRPARWYGSRILPLFVALPLPFLYGEGAISEFCQIIALSIVLAAVYAISAYGAFASTAEFESQPRSARTALAALLWSSAVVLYLLLTMNPALIGLIRQRPAVTLEQFNVLNDGRIALTSPARDSDTSLWACDRNGVVLEGKRRLIGPDTVFPITLTHADHNLRSYLDDHEYVFPYTTSHEPIPAAGSQSGYAIDSRAASDEGSDGVTWYFNDRSRQLLGYQGNQLVSVAGSNGFYSPEKRDMAGHFDAPLPAMMSMIGSYQFLMRQGSRLMAVSLDQRSVQPIALPVTARDVRLAATWPAFVTSESNTRKRIAELPCYSIVTRDRIYFLNRANTLLFSALRQFTESRYPIVSVTAFPRDGREFVFYQKTAGDGFAPGQLSVLDGSGRQIALTPIPEIKAIPMGNDDAANNPSGYDAIGCPITLAAFVAQGYGHALIENKRAVRELIICIAAAIAWALCGLLISRRWGLRWTACIPWAIAAFLLGIPGVIAQLALRGYPTRVPCPNCKNPRAATEDLCEYCGAPFPGPTINGTEIFGDLCSTNASSIMAVTVAEKDFIR